MRSTYKKGLIAIHTVALTKAIFKLEKNDVIDKQSLDISSKDANFSVQPYFSLNFKYKPSRTN